MSRWGQLDLKSVAIPMVASVFAWFGGTVWARYDTVKSWEWKQKEQSVQLQEVRDLQAQDHAVLQQLPVQELRQMPGWMARTEDSIERLADAIEGRAQKRRRVTHESQELR